MTLVSNKILFASVLKPQNDVRMYEKMAKSLVKDFSCKVYIFGQKSNKQSEYLNIIFIGGLDFKRRSWKRIFINFSFLFTLLKVKPLIVVPNTYELLPATLFYKWFFKSVFIYDVRENYLINIKYSPYLNTFFKNFFSYTVRILEKKAFSKADEILLAERSYKNEIQFQDSQKITIIENKMLQFKIPKIEKDSNKLVFAHTGTLSYQFGLMRAIHFIDEIVKVFPNSELFLTGFCPVDADFNYLQKLLITRNYIKLIGGDKFVPHPTIIETLCKADFVLLPYLLNPSNQNCIPTKMYESWYLKKPMIIQENVFWNGLCKENLSAIFIDFDNFETIEVLNSIKNQTFYTENEDISKYRWENEESKFLNVFKKYIH